MKNLFRVEKFTEIKNKNIWRFVLPQLTSSEPSWQSLRPSHFLLTSTHRTEPAEHSNSYWEQPNFFYMKKIFLKFLITMS